MKKTSCEFLEDEEDMEVYCWVNQSYSQKGTLTNAFPKPWRACKSQGRRMPWGCDYSAVAKKIFIANLYDQHPLLLLKPTQRSSGS